MKKGSHHSEEAKEKNRLSHLANPNSGQFNLGHKHTEESREKNRLAHLGKPQSEETKKKRSESMKGKNVGELNGMYGVHKYGKDAPGYGNIAWNKDTHIQLNAGKTHFKKGQKPWNAGTVGLMPTPWNKIGDGITPLNQQIRHSSLYIEWRDWIFEWDNYTCQKCGEKGGILRAHHIKQFADIMEKNKIKSLEEAIVCNELFDVGNGITYCRKCHINIHRSK